MKHRWRPIDLLRGAAMALMVIDHVRVFGGVPAGGPSAGIFFTRWVTHFCAPIFIFLAGTSAYLSSRGQPASALTQSLLKRGLWLVFVELTFLRLAWTFNFDYQHFTMLGVIWVIGACMVLLSLLSRLPAPLLLAFGLLVVGGHNAVGPVLGAQLPASMEGPWASLLRVVYFGGGFPAFDGLITIQVLYSIVPWIGVMALGFVFGRVVECPEEKRTRVTIAIGVGATLLFLILRWTDVYGNPGPWRGAPRPALLAFINVAKYPASLLFLLMTLGPSVAVLPLLDRVSGRVGKWLETFGRVPMFFYLIHIPLIHSFAFVIAVVRTPNAVGWLFGNHPMNPPPVPANYQWSLGLLYGVTLLALAVLLPLCRAYGHAKETRRRWWYRYI
ncbi:MAG: heparan-alpha-glucosaminide N-acetyltransferase domain-containing protein [Vicinamibacteria bacterium]